MRYIKIEKRNTIKFCFILSYSAIEAYDELKKVICDAAIIRPQILRLMNIFEMIVQALVIDTIAESMRQHCRVHACFFQYKRLTVNVN